MIEVDYGGGGHRTRLGEINRSTCVSRGAPASVYKGGEEGRLAGQGGEAQESPTPSGSRIPPFLVELEAFPSSRSRREGKGKEKRRKEGGVAPPPSPIRTRGEGVRGLP